MNKLIIVIIVLAVIVGGIFLFTQGRSTTNNTQPTAQPTTTQKTVSANMVTIQNFSFNPATLTVKQGTKVTWENQDSVTHRIKSDTFNSENLNPGDKFEFTFNNKGTFDYICGIHPSMMGKIVVE